MSRMVRIWMTLSLVLFLAACGPPAEEQAPNTGAADNTAMNAGNEAAEAPMDAPADEEPMQEEAAPAEDDEMAGDDEEAMGEADVEGPVVVYTSVDVQYAEPLLEQFTADTGIEVEPVFDVEAAKTTGLVNRLIEEQDRPQADVWWNGEFAQTLELADQGLFQPYASPNAEGIPEQYISEENLWTGFGGRARVIIINTNLLDEADYPTSVFDLRDYEGVEPDQIGMALPMFGTTATHTAAMYAQLGRDQIVEFYQALADRGIRVVDGNSVVRDMVADGQLAFGMTDTDDACGAIERGAPVTTVFPDQGEDGMGTLVVPNTAALVNGAPHPEAGQALIDWLLSEEIEAELINIGWSYVSLRDVGVSPDCIDVSGVKTMDVGLVEISEHIEEAIEDGREIFAQ